MKRLFTVLLLGVGSMAALAQTNPQAGAAPTFVASTISYRCASGTWLQVAYLNIKNGESFATIYFGGKLTQLRGMDVASGAGYASLDEKMGLRWRTKGAEGALYRLAPGSAATEKVLLRDCKAAKN